MPKSIQELRQNKWLNRLIEFFQSASLEDETRVFIFGSRARGDADRVSDIDIGLINKNGKAKLSQLREDIDNLNLPYSLDLLDLNSVSETFYKESMQDAVQIFPLKNE